jgi:pyridoxine 5-phosphate synthase
LDVIQQGAHLRRAAERLRQRDIAVSIFLDPHPGQIEAVDALGRDLVHGFEINTDAYTKAWLNTGPHSKDTATADAAVAEELARVKQSAEEGAARGLAVYAGHGLTTENVIPIAALPQIEELNIGHWLVSRAALVGMAQSVQEMLEAMQEGREA